MAGSRKQARHLRNNSTYPEVKLWNYLKQDQIGFMFKRQWLIGGFILDFYCAELKLAIEIDGKIHRLKVEQDKGRDLYLASEGIHLFRIPARRVYRNGFVVAMHVKDICEKLSMGTLEREDISNGGPSEWNASLDREAAERGTSEAGESIERSE